MNEHLINLVTSSGYDVWMRNVNDSWIIFTDGKSLGYLEDGCFGINISTVHIPNQRTGTGFQMLRGISVVGKTELEQAFAFCPPWASGDASTVKKYRDIEHYRAANQFNAQYQLVACGKRAAEAVP